MTQDLLPVYVDLYSGKKLKNMKHDINSDDSNNSFQMAYLFC